jgi:hypothetical protein
MERCAGAAPPFQVFVHEPRVKLSQKQSGLTHGPAQVGGQPDLLTNRQRREPKAEQFFLEVVEVTRNWAVSAHPTSAYDMNGDHGCPFVC